MKQWWVSFIARPRIAYLRLRFAPQIAFARARLSPGNEFGLRLTLGVLLIVGAAWLFGGVAEDVVTGDPLTEVDVQVSHWFHAHASASVTRYVLIFTHLHGTIGIVLLSAALALYFLWRRQRYWLLTVLIVVPCGMLLNVLLKQVFLRQRPSFDDPLLTLTSYSFPSGHVAGATLFYGVLAAFLVSSLPTWSLRVLAVLGACLLVVLVGLTRIYLGVHYVSDVVAAAAWSTAWLVLCLFAIDALRRRRRRR